MIAIAAGFQHNLALTSDGKVYAWGSNVNGQIGDGGALTARYTPVQLTYFSDNNVFAISAAGNNSFAAKDGGVWAWGSNSNWQLGNNSVSQSNAPLQVSGLTEIVSVTAGNAHAVAMKGDGTVYAWGDNHYGQLGNGTLNSSFTPVQVSGLNDAVVIIAGNSFSLGLKPTGMLQTWGLNTSGQLGDGTLTQRTTPVSASGFTVILPH